MINNNRIRCTATINASGVIVVGSPATGFVAPTNLWADGASVATGTVGEHRYLLEDGTGGWELGVVVCTTTTTSTRTVLQTNVNAPTGYANNATGLTLSMVADDTASWASRRSTLTESAPAALDTGMAAGCNASAGVGSVAVGYNARALGDYALSVGIDAGAATAVLRTVCLGVGAVANNEYSVALGDDALAVWPYEVALKNIVSVVRLTGSHNATASVMDGTLGGLSFTLMEGFHSIKGNVKVSDFDNGGTLTYMNLFAVDYHVYSDGATVSVIGTPTITTVYTGASVGTSVLTIDATTGLPELTYSGGGASHIGDSVAALIITHTGL